MSTRDDRLLAGKAIFAKVVAQDVKAVVDDTRDLLEPLLAPDEGIAAELPDGTRIGTVKRSKVRKAAAVTDERALLAWVRENRPDELIESVNPAFVDWLKGQAKKHGFAVVPSTGEVVPGVEMVDGAPSYLPQPDPDMVPLIQAKLAELIGHGLLALPSGDEGPA